MKKLKISYYGLTVFFNLLVWIPLFFEIQSKIGLTNAEIFNIQSIYYLAFIIFEIPTGHIADQIGKKFSILIGSVILIFANLAPIITPGFYSFLSHFILIALSRSLLSGSTSAYLYDYLTTINQTEEYKSIEGKSRSLGLIAKLVVWPLSGLLFEYSTFSVYYITALFSAIGFIFALNLPNEEINPKSKVKISFRDQIKVSFLQFKINPNLIYVVIQGSALFIIQRVALIQLFQPLLKLKNFDTTTFGIILSITTASEAIASAFSHKLKKRKFSDKELIFIFSLFLTVFFILLGLMPKFFTPILFIGLGLFCGLIFPYQKQLMNDQILDKSVRASVLSIESIIQRLLASFFTFLTGYFITKTDLGHLFIGFGVLIMLILFFNFKLGLIKQGNSIDRS